VSARPTLVLADDDERTVVDSTMPAARSVAEPGCDGSGHPVVAWWTSASGRWRSWLLAAVVIGLCVSLVCVASEQRRLSVRLQRTLDAMSGGQRSIPSPEKASSLGLAEAPGGGLVEARAPGPAAQVATREELELAAANLVVSNDFRAAIEAYLALAARFQDQPAFSNLATILRAKIACESPRRKGVFGCDSGIRPR